MRYNWIEGGNRQLDLVDGEDSSLIRNDPGYPETHVYGNILLEPDAAGNRQMVHYGGDSGVTGSYRKGVLYFYNNTLVSTRTDRTTLFRLSTNDEHCDFRNNIAYVTAAGNTLSLLDSSGVLNMTHNWFKPGYVSTFGSLTGTIQDDGTSVIGSSPGFLEEANQIYTLAQNSACINAGTVLHSAVLPANDVVRQYVKHQSSEARPSDGGFDIGAYEYQSGIPADLNITTSSLPTGTVGDPYDATLAGTGGITPYTWSIISGSLPAGLSLNSLTGEISGTPTQPETSNFTVQVTDAQTPPDSASKPLSIKVESAQVDPLNITTTSLPSARRNKNYNQSLQATGGVTPYQWSILSGSLPPGLNLNGATGVISGKATTLGTWSFVVQVRDNQNAPTTDTQNLSITVRR